MTSCTRFKCLQGLQPDTPPSLLQRHPEVRAGLCSEAARCEEGLHTPWEEARRFRFTFGATGQWHSRQEILLTRACWAGSSLCRSIPLGVLSSDIPRFCLAQARCHVYQTLAAPGKRVSRSARTVAAFIEASAETFGACPPFHSGQRLRQDAEPRKAARRRCAASPSANSTRYAVMRRCLPPSSQVLLYAMAAVRTIPIYILMRQVSWRRLARRSVDSMWLLVCNLGKAS